MENCKGVNIVFGDLFCVGFLLLSTLYHNFSFNVLFLNRSFTPSLPHSKLSITNSDVYE